MLPLAIPSFVLAYVYTYLLDTAGPVEQTWHWLTQLRCPHIPSPYSFTGALVVMTLNTFPYVYLLARAAFQNFNLSFEEAAQATGATRRETFLARLASRSSGLPWWPACFSWCSTWCRILGPSRCCAFKPLRTPFINRSPGRFDYQSAALLSLLLVGFALVFLFAERWFRKQSRFYQTSGRVRTATLQNPVR